MADEKLPPLQGRPFKVRKPNECHIIVGPGGTAHLTQEECDEVIRIVEEAHPEAQARIAELEWVAKELLDEAERRSMGFPSKWTKAEGWMPEAPCEVCGGTGLSLPFPSKEEAAKWPEEIGKPCPDCKGTALQAYIEQGAQGWMPISSAPKDGTEVLLCQAYNADGKPISKEAWGLFVQRASWWEGSDAWVVYCDLPDEPRLSFYPTHWQPLPQPPSGKKVPQ